MKPGRYTAIEPTTGTEFKLIVTDDPEDVAAISKSLNAEADLSKRVRNSEESIIAAVGGKCDELPFMRWYILHVNNKPGTMNTVYHFAFHPEDEEAADRLREDIVRRIQET